MGGVEGGEEIISELKYTIFKIHNLTFTQHITTDKPSLQLAPTPRPALGPHQ